MNYYIITGISRGLGEALASQLLGKGNCVIGISRKNNIELIELAKLKACEFQFIEFDLNNTDGIESLGEKLFEHIDFEGIESIGLINNAGVIAPIKTIEQTSVAEIAMSLNVNTVAPMAITSIFIKKLKAYNVEKRVINISSGAGKKPYHGWACYCSSKAAMDMFTKCVAMEQKKEAYPTKILAFAPGIMDTGMQRKIRETSVENFDQLQRFIEFKEKDLLLTAGFVAEKVIGLLNSSEFSQGGIIDIKDL